MAIDGKLTLSENIADLAGLSAAYDAWRTSLGGAPAAVQAAVDDEAATPGVWFEVHSALLDSG